MPKISLIPAAGELTGAEEVVINQDGATKRLLLTDYVDPTDIAKLSERMVGPVEPLAAGTVVANSNIYYWPQALRSVDQWLTAIETGMGTAGGFVVVVAAVNGDGTLDLIETSAVSVATGRTITTLPQPIHVPPGAIVGLRRISGN